MSEELLPYYNRELAYLRRMGAQFAEEHPKIAGRLRMRAEGTQDPHVERMIEAFAYLNARIRFKLEDDFPEITHALLDVLYPHYLAPIPSMSIAKMTLDRSQTELTSGYQVPRDTAVETDAIEGAPCRFRTCYPVTLWPIEVSSAEMSEPPFTAPTTSVATKADALLRLTLRCFDSEMTFGQLEANSFRFFVKAQPQHAYPLYELIFNNTLAVVLANSVQDERPVSLTREAISPVGFERDEGLLPYPNRSFLGYRLISEYFSFPEKFLFFDLSLAGLSPEIRSSLGNTIEVFLFLDRSIPELEHNITRDTFQLGCTPIVNLFTHRAEPIRLTHRESEYRVVPDARRPLATEVYSVDRVVATSPANEEMEFQPFYSCKHASEAQRQVTYWQAIRRPGESYETTTDAGTEVYLRLVDLGFSPSVPAEWTLDVETTCLNRDLPHRLPFGGGQPRLTMPAGGPISSIECLTPPTPTFRPALQHGVVWRLISHLSLNHLSLCDYEDGADALREILKLYDFADSEETRSTIDGIRSVSSRRVVGRSAGGIAGGLCRGVETTIEFDEERYAGSGIFLFACVLERFLGLYCSINSFSKLIAATNKREGALKQWPPRAGEKVLL